MEAIFGDYVADSHYALAILVAIRVKTSTLHKTHAHPS